VLEAAGLTEEDIENVPIPSRASLRPPPVVTETSSLVWPVVGATESFFDRALANANGDVDMDEPVRAVNGHAVESDDVEGDDWAADEAIVPGEEAEEAWDLAQDDVVPEADVSGPTEEAAEEAGGLDGETRGLSEETLWTRNSPLAADHIAAGSFDTAMQVRGSLAIAAGSFTRSRTAAQPASRRRQL
jgi:coatomer protein complex subunit alpha (xenin)